MVEERPPSDPEERERLIRARRERDTFRAGPREFDTMEEAIDFAERNDFPEIQIIVGGEVSSTHDVGGGKPPNPGNPNGNGVRFVAHTSRQGEWGDEFFEDDILDVDGDDVVVSRSPGPAVDRDELDEVAVIWSGALDFEGTLEEARGRYPDLAEFLD